MRVYKQIVFIFLAAFVHGGQCQQALDSAGAVNDTQKLVSVLQSKPEYGGLIDAMNEIDVLESSGAPKKKIVAAVNELIKRVQFTQKYSADVDLDLVLAWCAARKGQPVKLQKRTAGATVVAASTAPNVDDFAIALSEKPEYAELFELFVDVQVLIAENAPVQKIRPAMQRLIKRIEFVKKYAQDPLLDDLHVWCYAQKGCGKKAMAAWKKALIATAAVVAAVAGIATGSIVYNKRRQQAAVPAAQPAVGGQPPVLAPPAFGGFVMAGPNGLLHHPGVVPQAGVPAPHGLPGAGVVGAAIGDGSIQVERAKVPGLEIGSIVKHNNRLYEILAENPRGYMLREIVDARVGRYFSSTAEWQVVSQYKVITIPDAVHDAIRSEFSWWATDLIMRGVFPAGDVYQEYNDDRRWRVMSVISPMQRFVQLIGLVNTGNAVQVPLRLSPLKITEYGQDAEKRLSELARDETCSLCREKYEPAQLLAVCTQNRMIQHIVGHVDCGTNQLQNCPVCRGSRDNFRSWQWDSWQERCTEQITTLGPGNTECSICAEELLNAGALWVCVGCKKVIGHTTQDCWRAKPAPCPLCRQEDASQIVEWNPPAGLTMQGGGGTAPAGAGSGASASAAPAGAGSGALHATTSHPSDTRVCHVSPIQEAVYAGLNFEVGDFWGFRQRALFVISKTPRSFDRHEYAYTVQALTDSSALSGSRDDYRDNYKVFTDNNHSGAPLEYTPPGTLIQYDRYARLSGAQGDFTGKDVWIYKRRQTS